jgi:hypothetical protein
MPAVACEVIDHEIALSEHLVLRCAEHLPATGLDAGGDALMLCVRVRDSDPHQLRDRPRGRWDLGAADVHDDDSTVGTDAELRAMVLADAGALDEAEHISQPVDGGTYVGINKHGHDGHGRDRPIALHAIEA